MKKLILIVVDALTPRVLMPAIQDGRLPNFAALAEAGAIDLTCSTIFPSITQAALSSLATGDYPKTHGVLGSSWFNKAQEQVIYFLDDTDAILHRHVGDYIHDLLVRLNRDLLKSQTIFERVEEAGLKTACINHLIHRGNVEHQVNMPLLASLLPGTSVDTVNGPALLYMGDMVTTALANGTTPPITGGLMRRYGMDDQFSADMLLYLAEQRALPDFTLTYFMDNDYESHKVGPQEAEQVLEKIDQVLGKLYALYGGLDALLDEFSIIITGDHAQSNIADSDAEAAIVLNELLSDFSSAPIAQPWAEEHDLLICPNMRAAQIYIKQPTPALVQKIADALLLEPRIDQIMWRTALSKPDHLGYTIATRDRGWLQFWPASAAAVPAAASSSEAADEWGTVWQWQGDLAAVDAQVDEAGILRFTTYPNAFERIVGALGADDGGNMWLTAQLGADFRLGTSTVHVGGGSHGSLHAFDSHVPVILAGAPGGVSLPVSIRTTDIFSLCLSILDLPLSNG